MEFNTVRDPILSPKAAMPSRVSTSLANLPMEVYGVDNKKNLDTPTNKRRIPPQTVASAKNCRVSKWSKISTNLSLYRGEKGAVKFPLVNLGK